jgi:hypothetical protein
MHIRETKIFYLILLVSFLVKNSVFAAQTCSRVAIINNQEVIVDTISTKKGEGLRYHISKDEIAKSFLDRYQEGHNINWKTATVGTAGSSLILAGFMTNSSNNNDKRLIMGGISLLLINFLMAKTLDNTNEVNFNRAIEEYNKRNIPKIILKNIAKDENTSDKPAVVLEKTWGF